MNFAKYCRHCGEKVAVFNKKENGNHEYKCGCHADRILKPEEMIDGFKLQARIDQLKAMHKMMLEANDERLYMTWIYRMPDCPQECDFLFIACNDEDYNGCFDLFVKLVAKDGMRW